MIIKGDCMKIMPELAAESFDTCVTSPPYWGLRDYGIPPSEWPEVTYSPMAGLPPITVPAWEGCLGLEPTPEMFVAHMVLVFREVWRLLRKDGTLWVNFGDSYASSPANKQDENWTDPANPKKGGRVLDPFGGSGTTLKVAHENNRECTIIELGEQYVEIAELRTAVVQPVLNI
ncbi:DNA methyltransferase [Paenibacillus lentus]|uniref:DNA methyltransferase n=1 Tax=Paenibacillus lentus TaxID=1338368 RepID=UPI003651576A